MRLLMLTLAALTWSHTAKAENPDWVRENTRLVDVQPCTDNATGEHGTCFLSVDEPVFYMTFVQDGEPVFIRRVIPGQPYETIWRARPPGTSL